MTGLRDLEATIAKLESATEECREATREAHQAIKDLRAIKREFHELLADPPACVVAKASDILEAEVTRQLGKLAPVTKDAMDKSVEKILSEFNRLEDIFMGREDPSGVPLDEALNRHVNRHGPGVPLNPKSTGRKRSG